MHRCQAHIDLQGSLYGIRGQRSADLFSFLVSFVLVCCIHTHLSKAAGIIGPFDATVRRFSSLFCASK